MVSENSIESVIQRAGVVPVVDLPENIDIVPVVKSLLKNGIEVIEITLRQSHSLRVIHDIIDSKLPIRIGAGTVRTREQVQALAEIPVDFMVTPGLNERIIDQVQQSCQIPIYPGVDSTLGIELAANHGIQLLKFFPATALRGSQWLKSIHGPYPEVKFMPTGGISLENLAEYIGLPNVIAVGGSFLLPKKEIKAQNWSAIDNICSTAREIIQNARRKK